MIDFYNLNKKISYFLNKEDTNYKQFMNFFCKLSNDYLKEIEDYNNIFDFDDDNLKYISYEENLSNVQDFLKQVNIDYLKNLNKMCELKQINIKSKKSDENYCGLKNKKPYLNISLTNSIDDSFCLVHEFMHSTNLEQKISLGREYLTESLSIFFEYLLYDYYCNIDYPNKDYYKIKIINFLSTRDNAIVINNDKTIIDLYLKNKQITFKNLKQNYSNDKEKYEEIKLMCDNYSKYYLGIFENKKYLLGTVLACYMHQRLLDDRKFIDKIFYLNENLNSLNLMECFEIIDLNFSIKDGEYNLDDHQYNYLIYCLKKELEEIYLKCVGEFNEQSYIYCRSNRSWKN